MECRSIQQSKLNNNVMDRVVWCFRSDSKQWRLVDINLYFEYVCGRTVLHFFAALDYNRVLRKRFVSLAGDNLREGDYMLKF